MGWLTNTFVGGPTVYIVVFLLGVGVGAVPAYKYEAAQKEAVRARFDGFVAQTKILGEQAAKDKKIHEESDRLNKERTDNEHKIAVDILNADIERLRKQSRTTGGNLRTPASPTPSPSGTCFDPTKLSEALRVLDNGLLQLVSEGAKAVVDLDSAKTWATNQK